MAKHKTSLSLSGPARRQLGELAEVYGSKSAAIEVAIERLWQTEVTTCPEVAPDPTLRGTADLLEVGRPTGS